MSKPHKCDQVIYADSSQLATQLETLCLSPKFSDFTLVVGVEKLCAHKAILSARSKFFERHFSSPDENQDEIVVMDAPYDAVVSFLTYIYSGKIMISSDINLTLSILILADRVELTLLFAGIMKQLEANINVDNVKPMLKVGNMFHLDELCQICHSFLSFNPQ